ncbi:MAG TPA: glycosyltransferase [Marmoricola sp.]|nr:glycosyltransferase [Marmoricola sp.]
MSRFLVYTSPAAGHVLPLVPGLLELRRRGHEVHVRTLASLVPTLEELGIEASSVDPRVTEIPITDHTATSDGERLRKGQTDLMARGAHDGPDLVDAVESFRPDAVLVDVNAYGAQTRAEASGLPRALLLPSVLPLPGAGIPPYGMGLRPRRGLFGAVRDRLLWRVVERMFARTMLPGLNALRAEAGLPAYSSPLDSFRTPDAVIALTSLPLEYERTDLPPHVHLVGSEPWDPAAERPAYLDEPGDPWVLVTCSTDYQGDERLARTAVEALAGRPYRVLVTMADAFDGAELPAAPNVRVERFVPHGLVLPETAVVICHGGMGIVSKATAHGVPLVVVPFGRDQPEIARRAAEAGHGVALKAGRLEAERLRKAVVAAEGLREQARAAAVQLRSHGGADRFADAVLTLVRNGHDLEVS